MTDVPFDPMLQKRYLEGSVTLREMIFMYPTTPPPMCATDADVKLTLNP